MLAVLAVLAGTGTMAAPTSASAAAPTAQATSMLTAQERGDLPAGARKVTKAGLVHGTIPAQVGDIVLAATVLHASQTDETSLTGFNGPGGSVVWMRVQRAIEENTSNEVRGYWRFRLTYGPDRTTWSTYHQGSGLRVHRDDRGTNQADGCLAYPNHCSWTGDPPDCRGPGPTCDYFIRTSLYRPKGDAADYWLTEFWEYRVWHPNLDQWILWDQCINPLHPGWISKESWWKVGGGTRVNINCPTLEGA
jgi:hypothetical protein